MLLGAEAGAPLTARTASTADRLTPPIREAIRLFETHVEDPLRIPDVAAAVSMSGRHFERLFKRETGQSPLRYYHHLRLMKARQRVLYSNDPLREIAAAVGYLTPAPMARPASSTWTRPGPSH